MNGSSVQPDILPLLSAGKHRTPRAGACFMEFASFLAGERWSDHPACTHAGLAHLARMVNDCSSDRARSKLATLIPTVIGLTTDDKRLDVILALRAASAALPVVAEERQHSLAVGALVASAGLDLMGGAGPVDIRGSLNAAFAAAPEAERWARAFIATNLRKQPTEISVRHSHSIIASSIDGIGRACISNPDDQLRMLLTAAIDDCVEFISATEPAAIPVKAPVAGPTAAQAAAMAASLKQSPIRTYAKL